VVALLVFALGAGVSFYEGVIHMLDPEPIENPLVNYVVLGLSIVFEGATWLVALKEFRRHKGTLGYFEAVRRSKDPSVFTILFEDSAALLGLVIALIGISLAQLLDMPALDGLASIGIACVLATTAAFLARESKGLLLGEAASPETQEAILAIAQQDPAVDKANAVLTVHLGPREIVAGVSIAFEDDMTAPEIEACVERIEARLKAEVPEVTALFVKPQTTPRWLKAPQEAVEPEPGSQG
jgi:divalent metal cation (Fe/Co/Zn/Cd) transporter